MQDNFSNYDSYYIINISHCLPKNSNLHIKKKSLIKKNFFFFKK